MILSNYHIQEQLEEWYGTQRYLAPLNSLKQNNNLHNLGKKA